MAIFSPTQLPQDVWTMDGAVIEFGTTTAAGSTNDQYDTEMIIAIQCQIQYGRSVARRYPINVRRAIYLVGAPEGTITFGLLFGPGANMSKFVDLFKNNTAADSGAKNNTTIVVTPFSTTDGYGNQSDGWIIHDPVLMNVSLTIQEAGDQNISSVGGATLRFANMDLESTQPNNAMP